ncbi:methyltransferase MT-A70 family protein [Actinidia rufa]|uniref:Methyltransferase MT-A70 family protein n=1 Tax=Actinidia rufa TaxID=165716 RepID=A0A7J0GVE3_9ERIC|nr:methyltransferase MT-A70 family protein [Actinidia rufa]
MDSLDGFQNYVKDDMEDGLDMKIDRARDNDEWEGDDKRKQRSSKSRKPGNGEEAEGLDGSGRRRSTVDKNESRKRSGGSSRVDSDEDDYEARKESRSKQLKKQQEEGTLEKLSSWYQDGEQENKHDGGERSSSRGHTQGDESEKRKSVSKSSDHDRIKGKDDRSHDGELEKLLERDSMYLERRETNREKDHGSSDQGKSRRRRWDETDAAKKAEESNHGEKSEKRSGKSSDLKRESAGEGSVSATIELSDSKSRGLDPYSVKGMKSYDREERKIDSESSKSKGGSEAPEVDNKGSYLTREDRSGKERNDKHRQQRNSSTWDGGESRERSFNTDDDGIWMRDKSRREAERSNRSKTPERSGRRYHESENFQLDHERGNTFKRKELEKDGYRDDKPKGRDDGWSDRKRDQGRRQPGSDDKETKDGDTAYDHGREWELQKYGPDRPDNERPLGRSGGRKDAIRTEAVKTSSNYGISNDNYDVIEIQTKPFDYGRGESRSTFSTRHEAAQQSDTNWAPNDEWTYPREDKTRKIDIHGIWPIWENQSPKRCFVQSLCGGQSSSSGSQTLHGNQELGSFSRVAPQGARGSRMGRGGRGRPSGRESQPFGISVPMMGLPFGPLGMPPPGPMQPLTPSLSPAPGPPFSPGVFLPPFSSTVVWPGARGVEMNMLAVPPGLSPVPPGPPGPRFSHIGTPPNPGMYFNQPGPGRGDSPNIPSPGINPLIPVGRGQLQDKASGNWVPPRTNGPPGKAPSRGEQNDYSQNFVDTGMRPQNFIRELELTAVVEDYPKLRELIQKKDEIVAKSASTPMYFKCDLHEHEYVHRAPGVTDHMEYWTFEEIMNLKIEAIADTPSFIFLWVGDGVGLEQGRQCLKKEHCLMGIKGTVRRSADGHIIHANIDTDVIIAEEPSYGSTAKPEDMYRIVEHFALGRRRLELFGEDHNIRSGWLTVGKGLSSSNFNTEGYIRSFSDKDGKVWQGGGGRNPPPEAPHLVLTTPEIESLRPKSPMKNQQQLQQSASISLTTANSSNKLQMGNSPQNPNALNLNQEASSSNFSTPGPWVSPMERRVLKDEMEETYLLMIGFLRMKIRDPPVSNPSTSCVWWSSDLKRASFEQTQLDGIPHAFYACIDTK